MKFAVWLTTACWMVLGASAVSAADTIDLFDAHSGEVRTVERVERTEEEWKKALTSEQYHIMREQGTERPFSKTCAIPPSGKGTYQCAGCGTDLFAYGNKFESGTGWPSFWQPVSELNVRLISDHSHGMTRTEVRCARCDSHLGHVFPDGPPPTHQRYCINSICLRLAPARG